MFNKKLARKISRLLGVKKVIVDDIYTVYFKSGHFKKYTLTELKFFYSLNKNNRNEFVNPDLVTEECDGKTFMKRPKVIDILTKFGELYFVVDIHVFYKDSCFKSIGIETENIIYERDNLESLKRLYEKLRQEEFKADWRNSYRVEHMVKSLNALNTVKSVDYIDNYLETKIIKIMCKDVIYDCEKLEFLEIAYQDILSEEKLAKKNISWILSLETSQICKKLLELDSVDIVFDVSNNYCNIISRNGSYICTNLNHLYSTYKFLLNEEE